MFTTAFWSRTRLHPVLLVGTALMVLCSALAAVAHAQATAPAASASRIGINLTASIGGSITHVAVDGNNAFVVEGQALSALDVSDPAKPIKLSSMLVPLGVNDLLANNGRIYVAYGAFQQPGGVRVFERDAGNQLRLLNTIGFAQNVLKIDVVDTTMYVVTESGLRIVDIDDILQPRLQASYDYPVGGASIRVSNNRAYLAARDGMRVLDVSKPDAPALLSTYAPNSGTAASVDVVGTAAYITTSDPEAVRGYRVYTVDVSNAASPAPLGSFVSGDDIPQLAFLGTTVYASNLNSIEAFDVSNPAAPVAMDTVSTKSTSLDVLVSNQRVYVAGGAAGLQIYDASTPSSLSLVGTYLTFAVASDTFRNQQYLYVAADSGGVTPTGGLYILDVQGSVVPQIVGSYPTDDLAVNVQVVGARAYLVAGDRLDIIDVTDPVSPTLLGSYTAPDTMTSVEVVGDLAYITAEGTGFGGLQIIDVGDPAQPQLRGSYQIAGGSKDVQVVGTTAYVVGFGGLQIIDVTAPEAPVALGSYATQDEVSALQVVEQRVYMTTRASLPGKGALVILDVRDPAAPALSGRFDTNDAALDVQVAGTRAYVAVASGLRIIDVRAPEKPTLLGSYDALNSRSLSLGPDVIYFANGDRGVDILKTLENTVFLPLMSD